MKSNENTVLDSRIHYASQHLGLPGKNLDPEDSSVAGRVMGSDSVISLRDLASGHPIEISSPRTHQANLAPMLLVRTKEFIGHRAVGRFTSALTILNDKGFSAHTPKGSYLRATEYCWRGTHGNMLSDPEDFWRNLWVNEVAVHRKLSSMIRLNHECSRSNDRLGPVNLFQILH